MLGTMSANKEGRTKREPALACARTKHRQGIPMASLALDPLSYTLGLPCATKGLCRLANTITAVEACAIVLAAAVVLCARARRPSGKLYAVVVAAYFLCFRLRADLAHDAGSAASSSSTTSRTRSSDLAPIIEAFLLAHECHHAYLDIGTNRGVQIRKLLEPRRYAGSDVLPIFDAAFGPSAHGRCHVCAIGFEPNPMHASHLRELQRRLRAAGAAVLILHAAAGVENGTLTFGNPQAADVSFSAAVRPGGGGGGSDVDSPAAITRVPQYYLAALIQLVDRHLRRTPSDHHSPKIVMKLDVEGFERLLWPHLRRAGAACLVDTIYTEWHEATRSLTMPPSERAEIASLHRGVTVRFGWGVSSLLTRPAGCRLRVLDVDDEVHPSQPWPTAPLCPRAPRRHQRSGTNDSRW
jgi:hypothetical protein